MLRTVLFVPGRWGSPVRLPSTPGNWTRSPVSSLPPQGELAYARRVVAAFEAAQTAGSAAIAVDGQMMWLTSCRPVDSRSPCSSTWLGASWRACRRAPSLDMPPASFKATRAGQASRWLVCAGLAPWWRRHSAISFRCCRASCGREFHPVGQVENGPARRELPSGQEGQEARKP